MNVLSVIVCLVILAVGSLATAAKSVSFGIQAIGPNIEKPTFSATPLVPLDDYPSTCEGWSDFTQKFYLNLMTYNMGLADDFYLIAKAWGSESKVLKTYSEVPFKISDKFLESYQSFSDGLEEIEGVVDDSLDDFYLDSEWTNSLQSNCFSDGLEEAQKNNLRKVAAIKSLFVSFQSPIESLFEEINEDLESSLSAWSQRQSCEGADCVIERKEIVKAERNQFKINQFSYCFVGQNLFVSACSCQWLESLTSKEVLACKELEGALEKNKIHFKCNKEEESITNIKESLGKYSSILKTWCEWGTSLGKKSLICKELVKNNYQSPEPVSCFQ